MPHKTTCCQCNSDMWLPDDLHNAARRSEKIVFYCPFGHPQIFPAGDTDLEIVRRERDRLKQQMAEREDRIRNLIKAHDTTYQMFTKLKKEKTKLVTRAKAGTCPCCHRTFKQMALHMQTKHPNFKAEQVA